MQIVTGSHDATGTISAGQTQGCPIINAQPT
jgi:hypothetical protein